MEYQPLFWHWIVFGVVLISMELLVPTFTLFWFGCAAVVVGGVVFFAPDLAIEWQVLVWGILSIGFAVIWFKVIKPMSHDKTKAGLALESMIGEVGMVIHINRNAQKGKLRFPAPLLGSDEWMFFSSDALKVGDSVRVVNISGNSLSVEKADR